MLINESIFRAGQAVSALATRGVEVSEQTVPRFIGVKAAKIRSAHAVTTAVIDSERAAQLLEEAGLPKASVDSVRQAAQMLRDTPMKTNALHASGAALTDVANTVLAENEAVIAPARAAYARELVTTPVHELDHPQLEDIAALSADPQVATAVPALSHLTNGDRTSLNAGVMSRNARASLDRAWAADRFGDDARAITSEIKRIISQVPAAVSTDDWRTLSALTHELPTSAPAGFSVDLSGVTPLREVARNAAYGDLDVENAQRQFARWKLAMTPERTLRTMARELINRDPAELTRADLSTLDNLLLIDRGNEIIKGSRSLRDESQIGALLPELARGTVAPGPALGKYFATWRVADMPMTKQRELAREIIARDPMTYTKRDWADLGAILRADPAGDILKGPRRFSDMATLESWVSVLARGEHENDPVLIRYIAAMRVADLPIAKQRTLAAELIARDPETLTPTEWATVAGILKNDPEEKIIRGSRRLSGEGDFDRLVPFLVGGEHEPATERFFANWRVADMSPAEQRSLVKEIVAREPASYTRRDWAMLDAVLEADPGGEIIKGPRRLNDVAPIGSWTRVLATGEGTYEPAVNRYMASWRVADVTEAKQRTLATELISRDPSSLSTGDWATLNGLFEADVNQTIIPGPRRLYSAARAHDLIAELASGAGVSDAEMDRYFAAWRAAAMTPKELRATALSLVERDPATLSRAEWATLDGILDRDPRGEIVDGARQLYGQHELSGITTGFALGMFHDLGAAGRYFSDWRRSLDPEFAAQMTAAQEALRAGTATDAQMKLLILDGHYLLDDLAEASVAARGRAGAVMLQSTGLAATRGANTALAAVRDALEAHVDLPPEGMHLRNETLKMLDDNLSRINLRVTPEGQVVGYSNHPEYAQIGEIRGNLDVLDMMAAHSPRPTTPMPAAATPAATAAATAPSDVIDW